MKFWEQAILVKDIHRDIDSKNVNKFKKPGPSDNFRPNLQVCVYIYIHCVVLTLHCKKMIKKFRNKD